VHNRAVYRNEELLSLNQLLPEAIENIRHQFRSLEILNQVKFRGALKPL